MYTLDEPTVKELEVIIQELPLKYGLPILNILQKIKNKWKKIIT